MYDIIPVELNKQNKKFVFSMLDKELKFNRYENSFLWLKDAGVALPVYNVDAPVIPLLASKNTNVFRLFSSDVGLLTSAYPAETKMELINKNGEVLGINSVKITSAEGIGFAIPINIIKPIIEQLVSNGEYITPTLGMFAYDKDIVPYINQELTQNIKLDTGIYVADVIRNSPAERSGMKRGDILLEIDGIKLEKMSELRTYIYSKKVGEKVNIKYIRGNKEYQISITLAKK